MGYETSYAFTRLQGSKENYEQLLHRVEQEHDEKNLAEDECYFGRWYWDDMKEALKAASTEFPDVLLEVEGEVDDCEHWQWKARVKNGEIEEVEQITLWEPFTHGNLIPVSDDPEKALDGVLPSVVKDLKKILPELAKACSKEGSDKFKGKNTLARFILKAALETVAWNYGPLDKDLNSREGKRLLALLKAKASLTV